MQNSIPGPQDHKLSQRQTLTNWAKFLHGWNFLNFILVSFLLLTSGRWLLISFKEHLSWWPICVSDGWMCLVGAGSSQCSTVGATAAPCLGVWYEWAKALCLVSLWPSKAPVQRGCSARLLADVGFSLRGTAWMERMGKYQPRQIPPTPGDPAQSTCAALLLCIVSRLAPLFHFCCICCPLLRANAKICTYTRKTERVVALYSRWQQIALVMCTLAPSFYSLFSSCCSSWSRSWAVLSQESTSKTSSLEY